MKRVTRTRILSATGALLAGAAIAIGLSSLGSGHGVSPGGGKKLALAPLASGNLGQRFDLLSRLHTNKCSLAAGSLSATISSFIRRTAMIPFVSDFLFGDPAVVLHELAALNSIHDVFIVLIDAAFAFQLPPTSAGWIDAFDVETGRSRIMSRAALAGMADRVREWQDGVEQAAKAADIDLVRVGIDPEASDLALIGFVAERRSRRVS